MPSKVFRVQALSRVTFKSQIPTPLYQNKPLQQIKVLKAGQCAIFYFIFFCKKVEFSLFSFYLFIFLTANVRMTFRNIQVKANLVIRYCNTFNSSFFSKTKALKEFVRVLSYSIASKNNKLFWKQDKYTGPIVQKSLSEKKNGNKKSQTSVGVLHVKPGN